jgi:tetratricopeptide (TPR) repeat protein
MAGKHIQGPALRGVFIAGILFASALPCFSADAAATQRATSERALMQGRVDEAIAGLRTIVAANPQDSQAHLLLCRAFYAEELPDPAVTECEAALISLDKNSVAQDWMGRAYGIKANHSGPIAGYKLANKVRSAFETAVNLDPENGDAVDDLSEYYVGAPAIVGGGLDKALALASRVEAQLPQQAHRIRGLSAEKNKDYATAEREFQAAVGAGGHSNAWTDLGNYYSRRNAKDKAVDALRHALNADRAHDASLVDVASILSDMHVELKLAEQALRDYLSSNAKTDAAPAFKAHLLLGQILQSQGDKAGARDEFGRALALAHGYVPAQKAMQQL